ncbi:MAG TPA: hypothetical protein VLX28_20635 [Thermoanaerobaculia bacterium]|nr:hypothetical protein [Thermoanaerobaculia bacterium]
MRKKLILLAAALALTAAASRTASALNPPHCVTTCCEDRPTQCMTCCPGHYCSDLACP